MHVVAHLVGRESPGGKVQLVDQIAVAQIRSRGQYTRVASARAVQRQAVVVPCEHHSAVAGGIG